MSNMYIDAGPPASGKVMLATTAYENPDASYTFSISRTRECLHREDIATSYLLLTGNCHVDDARNTVVAEFLRSDCSELVFLDADVSWEPGQLLALCRYDCDVVGGVYPYRREAENMPVRMMADALYPDENGLMEVEGLPTGFLRIRRTVLELMAEKAVHFRKGADDIPILFQRDVYEGGRRGGDIGFCMRWREMGGKLFAAANLRLGHTGKVTVRDSLAASLRRQSGETLQYLVDQVRTGKPDIAVFTEARDWLGNKWSATEDVLSLCALVKASGPIIETGSGLTTIILAAANPDHTVWCIEHDPVWALRIEQMAAEAGVSNIAIVTCDIRNRWYDIGGDRAAMPDHFSLGLNDGPPRTLGSRMGFYEAFGSTDTIIADDADDPGYRDAIQKWCDDNDRDVDFVATRGALIRKRGES